MPMFIKAIFIINSYRQIVKSGDNPSIHQQMNRLKKNSVIYYSALKRNEVLTHAATWKNLENITLSEIIQTQKGKFYMVPFA